MVQMLNKLKEILREICQRHFFNKVEIPEELMEVRKDLAVSMDGLTLNSLTFLFTISRGLYYKTMEYVTKPFSSIYKGCTYKFVSIYKKGSFNITEIHCNNEFLRVMGPFLAK